MGCVDAVAVVVDRDVVCAWGIVCALALVTPTANADSCATSVDVEVCGIDIFTVVARDNVACRSDNLHAKLVLAWCGTRLDCNTRSEVRNAGGKF